jgi:hypothetical protein
MDREIREDSAYRFAAYGYGANSKFRAGISALGLSYVVAIIPTVKVRRVSDDGAPEGPRRSVKETWRSDCQNILGRRSPGVREQTRSCAPALPAFKCVRRQSGVPQNDRRKRC